eukprot:CAMPEP_0197245028 /NCGR_PEP_ID=MMETSP1429-20130617/9945_1 /TAXON_ID=49237 /ORGANISM="Chaetoceros  sp., Strain UNC1202" /LENGTH=574 /DNA_ID=CAMNT_0042705461 /DNA_START=93 /DNA_END=1817 /DNA_ORIENTATION=+
MARNESSSIQEEEGSIMIHDDESHHSPMALLFKLAQDGPRSKVKDILCRALGDDARSGASTSASTSTSSPADPTIAAGIFLSAFQIRKTGKSDVFFFLLTELAWIYPQTVEDLVPILPSYGGGSFEDWFQLVDYFAASERSRQRQHPRPRPREQTTDNGETYNHTTLRPIVHTILDLARDKLLEDEQALNAGHVEHISLLAKWAPPCDTQKGFGSPGRIHGVYDVPVVLANKMFPSSHSPKKEYRRLISRLHVAMDSGAGVLDSSSIGMVEVRSPTPEDASKDEGVASGLANTAAAAAARDVGSNLVVYGSISISRDRRVLWKSDELGHPLYSVRIGTTWQERCQLETILEASFHYGKRTPPPQEMSMSMSAQQEVGMEAWLYDTALAGDQDWVHLTIHEPAGDEIGSSSAEVSSNRCSRAMPGEVEDILLGISQRHMPFGWTRGETANMWFPTEEPKNRRERHEASWTTMGGDGSLRSGAEDSNVETELSTKVHAPCTDVVYAEVGGNARDEEKNAIIEWNKILSNECFNKVRRVLSNSNEGSLRYYKPSEESMADVFENEDETVNIVDWQMV